MSPTLQSVTAPMIVFNTDKLDSTRSPEWEKARNEHLIKEPACRGCGSRINLEVHHKEPFHLDPAKELDPSNFITLCECDKNGMNCHLLLGHLGDFKAFNPNVVADADAWHAKLTGRQYALTV